jgi:hypothetical protein
MIMTGYCQPSRSRIFRRFADVMESTGTVTVISGTVSCGLASGEITEYSGDGDHLDSTGSFGMNTYRAMRRIT